VADFDTLTREIRDNARNLAALLGVMQGTYFAALSISDVKAGRQPLELLLFFAPFVFWTLALVLTFFLWVSPRLRRWYDKEEQTKHWLSRARRIWGVSVLIFFLGLMWMSVVLAYYFFFMDLPCP